MSQSFLQIAGFDVDWTLIVLAAAIVVAVLLAWNIWRNVR